jgi:hypothetical protein
MFHFHLELRYQRRKAASRQALADNEEEASLTA